MKISQMVFKLQSVPVSIFFTFLLSGQTYMNEITIYKVQRAVAQNISNVFQVTESTQFCDRQTDGKTNSGKNNMSPHLKVGRHKKKN